MTSAPSRFFPTDLLPPKSFVSLNSNPHQLHIKSLKNGGLRADGNMLTKVLRKRSFPTDTEDGFPLLPANKRPRVSQPDLILPFEPREVVIIRERFISNRVKEPTNSSAAKITYSDGNPYAAAIPPPNTSPGAPLLNPSAAKFTYSDGNPYAAIPPPPIISSGTPLLNPSVAKYTSIDENPWAAVIPPPPIGTPLLNAVDPSPYAKPQQTASDAHDDHEAFDSDNSIPIHVEIKRLQAERDAIQKEVNMLNSLEIKKHRKEDVVLLRHLGNDNHVLEKKVEEDRQPCKTPEFFTKDTISKDLTISKRLELPKKSSVLFGRGSIFLAAPKKPLSSGVKKLY